MAIERSQPGAVMAAYNKVNGDYAAANDVLINQVLKGAWGYRGWVMSDWGATPSWECALAGLDQECGAQIDALLWQSEAFGEPLRAALRRRQAAQRAPVGHGPADPAFDVRGRNRPARGRARAGLGRAQRDCIADRTAGNGAAGQPGGAAAGARVDGADRRHRRLRARRCCRPAMVRAPSSHRAATRT